MTSVPTAHRGDPAAAVARAVLYEGYVLWPYRRTAPKNQRRWTFGGIHPLAWTASGHPDDVATLRAQCLVTGCDAGTTVHVTLRFLQVVERRVATIDEGRLAFVDTITVGDQHWTAWDEAREREVILPPLALGTGAVVHTPIAIPAASEPSWLHDAEGRRRAAVVRTWHGLDGDIVARCEPAGDATWRLEVVVTNTSEPTGAGRPNMLRSAFASSHLVLRLDGTGEFVSLTDPPDSLATLTGACSNTGWWPILVGPDSSRDTMLVSPIILPDHPEIAEESPGDLFDGGEIDEMLTLHILALTDRERDEMRATDPRTREILDRTLALADDQIRGLHGRLRGGLAEDSSDPFWRKMGRVPDQQLVLAGVRLARGSRVRLHPRNGGDVMDLALAGRVAIVEGIEEDEAGAIQLAVAIEGDPGADLGMDRMPGHRFFFRPEEVEPLAPIPHPASRSPATPRILVAGIGNIFFGDDGFGVEVARRLGEQPAKPGVTVKDFGIRGLDLAFAMRDFEAVILVDAMAGNLGPGTIRVLDVSDAEAVASGVDSHGMNPIAVLALARTVGPLPPRVYVVGCEPATIPDPGSETIVSGLSEPVRAAIEPAIAQVQVLIAELTARVAAPQPTEDSP